MPQAAMAVGLAANDADFEGILALQRENLKPALTPAEATEQGFVTLVHTLDMLRGMHALASSIVAKSGDTIVGYALTMLCEARSLVPALEPMFEEIERVTWRGSPLTKRRFYVLGQICLARSVRSTGLFGALYAEHDARYADRFDCLVTIISPLNARSLRAHAKVGFETVSRYPHGSGEQVLVARAMRRVSR
jgi:hypothetical protein